MRVTMEERAERRPPVFGCCWPRCPQTRLSTLRAATEMERCSRRTSLWPLLINIILIYAADWIEGIWLIHSIFPCSRSRWTPFLCVDLLRYARELYTKVAAAAAGFISIWFIRAHGADCVLTWLDHQRFECGVADEYSTWRLCGMENCAFGDRQKQREREKLFFCVLLLSGPRRTAANHEFYDLRNACGNIPHSSGIENANLCVFGDTSVKFIVNLHQNNSIKSPICTS